jgi:hypothetical protein
MSDLGTGTPSSSNFLRGDGSWQTVAASPAGSNTQIQYNNSGSFGASSMLVWTSAGVEVLDTANIVLNKNLLSDTQGILDLQVVGTSKIKFNPYDAGGASRATFNADPFLFENVHATGQFLFNSKGSYIFRENGNSWFYLTNSQTCGVNVSSPSAKLEVRVTSGAQFMASYDASNYYSVTVGSSGGVTFDAVGSGAKFTFSDSIEVADAKDIIVGTSTGTKIGTSTSQKLGFFNATPVTQRADIGALTDSTGGTPGTTIQDVGGAFDQDTLNDNFASLAAQINALRTEQRDLGFMA